MEAVQFSERELVTKLRAYGVDAEEATKVVEELRRRSEKRDEQHYEITDPAALAVVLASRLSRDKLVRFLEELVGREMTAHIMQRYNTSGARAKRGRETVEIITVET